MKKRFNTVLIITLMSLIVASLFGCKQSDGTTITTTKTKTNAMEYQIKIIEPYDSKEIDLSEKIIRNYYRFKNQSERQAEMLKEQLDKSSKERTYGDKQNISFSWEDTGINETYIIKFSYDANFNDVILEYETSKNSIEELGVFIPGLTYYYKVVGSNSGESMVDSFKTKNLPVRYITAGAVLNMRDIGGYQTKDGSTVKYGMLYRGGALDGSENPQGAQYILERGTSRLDDMGLKVFNEYLGIKGEIDLRGVTEDQHMTPAFNDDPKLLCQLEGVAASALWNKPEDVNVTRAFKEYFKFLADESNYPIYFHCNGGADRTGALAFLINGLLGVEYDDLCLDYELTSFSFAAGGIRKRSDIGTDPDGNAYFLEANDKDPAVAYCVKTLIQRYGDSTEDLTYAIENYLIKACGVTKEEISSIRRIMLEK